MKEVLFFGPFRLDIAGRQLWRGDEQIDLPPKAFDLLLYLAERPGELLTRETLLSALWGDVVVEDHALSVQIREIRKALGDDVHQPKYVETRHRRGYCFRAPVTRGEAQLLECVHDARPSPEPAPIEVPATYYASSGDVNIAYQVIGDGPVDLVFVMGWISHLEYFWTEPRFARFLRRLGSFSRVILFDKRGTGLSDRVPLHKLPTIEQRMEDLNAVMDAAGSSRAVICGVSEGGSMSAVFAATHPERTLALVMLGTYARRLWTPEYPWAPTVEQRAAFLREIQEHWGGPVGLEERAPSLAEDPAFRRWWATYLRMGASPGAAVALTQMNTEVDIRDILPAVRVPTLVIHRTDDQCLKVHEGRYVASLIPGAMFVELPGVDHLPFVGDQESILTAIERFVDDLRRDLPHDRSLATVLSARIVATGEFAGAASLENQLAACVKGFRASGYQLSVNHVLAAFDGPARAVRAAQAVLDSASQYGFHGAAGLHTGECAIEADGQLSGTAATIARRIEECAPLGELLVSGTVRDLTAGSGLVFEPRGRLEQGELGEWQLLRLKSESKQIVSAAFTKG